MPKTLSGNDIWRQRTEASRTEIWDAFSAALDANKGKSDRLEKSILAALRKGMTIEEALVVGTTFAKEGV